MKLLRRLHDIPFEYTIPRDANRESDGVEMRYRFGDAEQIHPSIIATNLDNMRCSMLEMMVALAVRCEDTIMVNDAVGNRTGQWFWEMIVSLGLGGQNDARFDQNYVDSVIAKFVRHDYKPNGEGGLFTVPNCQYDMRSAEIWYQMNWYLLTIGD
jgi:hypothetical protein